MARALRAPQMEPVARTAEATAWQPERPAFEPQTTAKLGLGSSEPALKVT